jgi:hypothetical protein
MFWILSFIFNPRSISSPDIFTTSFSAKYILLSSFLAVISAYVLEGFRKFKLMSKDLIREEETQEETEKSD